MKHLSSPDANSARSKGFMKTRIINFALRENRSQIAPVAKLEQRRDGGRNPFLLSAFRT
jgi:hypothetical protein